MSSMDVDIERLVIVTEIGNELDLEKIAQGWEGCEYNKDDFPGIIMDLDDEKGLLLFESGNMVISGSRGMKEARTDLENVVKKLRDIGVLVPKDLEFSVQSAQARIKVADSLDLKKVYSALDGKLTAYDPDRYPAVLFGDESGGYQMLIFSSGNVIFTGSRDMEDYRKGAEKLLGMLKLEGVLQETSKGGD